MTDGIWKQVEAARQIAEQMDYRRQVEMLEGPAMKMAREMLDSPMYKHAAEAAARVNALRLSNPFSDAMQSAMEASMRSLHSEREIHRMSKYSARAGMELP